MPVRIAASLAAAPQDRLGEAVSQLAVAGVDALHFDIEDGSFVPMMTLGTKMITDLRPLTTLPFDVHLMMVDPEWIVPELVRMGADRLSVHFETCPYPRRILRQIASFGIPAGLAFNPATPLPDLSYLLPYLAFVLILTTEPEIPDSLFLSDVLNKIRNGRRSQGMERVEWVVDGGVDSGNLVSIVQAGADSVVVGRAIFDGGSIRDNVRTLRAALE